MSLSRWLLSIASLLLILVIAWWEVRGERIGPGPLHPVHARSVGDGGGRCEECHDAKSRVRADGCIACHGAIGEQRRSGRGLHGGIDAKLLGNCGDCHREHHGDRTPLIAAGAFASVGVADVARYDHRHVTGWKLTGVHTTIACAKCHLAFDAAEPPKGGRCLGLEQRCTACHEDSHRGSFGDDCASCHGQELAFAKAPGFRHEAFALVGGHAKVACARCHEAGSRHAIGAAGREPGRVRGCAECHADPHGNAPANPDHVAAAASAAAPAFAHGGDCSTCHDDRGWKTKFAASDHARFGFELRGAHATTACDACHPAAGTPARYVAPAPAAAACARCHADPHLGAALDGERPASDHRPDRAVAQPVASSIRLSATADCARCHREGAWADARPTVAAHEPLGLPLRGPHAAVECAACHGDATHAARWSAPAPRIGECARCHEHQHAPAFVAAATAADGPATGCAGCHLDTDDRFATQRTTPLQHAATGFPLTRPHDAVACDRCHAGNGRAARFPGRRPDDCRTCHADVHRGQFARDGVTRQCTDCHAATEFTPHRFDVAAHAQTSFPLTGAHAAVACPSCHKLGKVDAPAPAVAAPAIGDVRRFHGTSSRCSDCHRDVHRGVFDAAAERRTVDGREGCARCHSTEQFAIVDSTRFDHTGWARWPLDGKHAALACAACHRAAGATTGYAPAAGRDCASCHADVHQGQFRGAGGVGVADCAKCHRSSGFHDIVFDHARDSAFPLDERHAHVPCASCHRTWPSAAGPVVRYKPLGTKCADCHRVAGGEVVRGERAGGNGGTKR